jgi:hypothetical protein
MSGSHYKDLRPACFETTSPEAVASIQLIVQGINLKQVMGRLPTLIDDPQVITCDLPLSSRVMPCRPHFLVKGQNSSTSMNLSSPFLPVDSSMT